MMHKPWKKLALIMLINKICGEMTDHMSPAMPPPFNDVDFLFFLKKGSQIFWTVYATIYCCCYYTGSRYAKIKNRWLWYLKTKKIFKETPKQQRLTAEL